MLHVTGIGRKFEIGPDRFTGEQQAKKWKPEHQGKSDADDDGSVHVSCYYMRPSSSSMTSTHVVTGGREPTGTLRLVAISCSRP